MPKVKKRTCDWKRNSHRLPSVKTKRGGGIGNRIPRKRSKCPGFRFNKGEKLASSSIPKRSSKEIKAETSAKRALWYTWKKGIKHSDTSRRGSVRNEESLEKETPPNLRAKNQENKKKKKNASRHRSRTTTLQIGENKETGLHARRSSCLQSRMEEDLVGNVHQKHSGGETPPLRSP